jgi:hypothetical protein
LNDSALHFSKEYYCSAIRGNPWQGSALGRLGCGNDAEHVSAVYVACTVRSLLHFAPGAEHMAAAS